MSDDSPDHNCSLCPRLAEFRQKNRVLFPDQFNAPVPSYGPLSAQLLIVGLAPGLKGANFTGRPFTADYAGDLLYPTLIKFGFARGVYGRSIDDGLKLLNTRITNAVRCVPPQNKPIGSEINACNHFLKSEISSMKNLRVIVSLGGVSHKSVIKAFGSKQASYKFGHNVLHRIGSVTLINSYHCSRYNTNTGRLTSQMFEDVFERVSNLINEQGGFVSTNVAYWLQCFLYLKGAT